MVLRLLARRGIGADDATAARVVAGEDGAALDARFDRAVMATRAEAVLSEPGGCRTGERCMRLPPPGQPPRAAAAARLLRLESARERCRNTQSPLGE